MIKAVLIDIDNTLLDFNLCALDSMRRGFFKFGLAFREEMFATFTRINDDLWLSLERGEITAEQLHGRRFDLVFEALGIQADGPAFERQFLENLSDSHEPVTGAMALLNYLKPKYALYAASNGPYAQQEKRLRLAGMLPYFQELFVSERIGAQKPTAAFFCHCMEHLPNLEREEILLIGDSLTADIAGGRDFGIKTIWYNHNQKEPDPSIQADYTVGSLKEIEHIL